MPNKLSVASCIVALFATTTSADTVYPLTTAPEGWIYLEKDFIDTFPGAYHDSVSGAFVRVEVALVPHVISWSEHQARSRGAVVTRAETDGVPYFMERRKHISADEQAKYRTKLEEGCEQIAIHFLPKGSEGPSWHLRGEACTPTQEERMLALMRGMASTVKNWPDGVRPPSGRLVTPQELAGIAPGMNWERVRARLGPPAQAEKSAADGFVVTYDVESVRRSDDLRVTLAFGKDHMLVRVGEVTTTPHSSK